MKTAFREARAAKSSILPRRVRLNTKRPTARRAQPRPPPSPTSPYARSSEIRTQSRYKSIRHDTQNPTAASRSPPATVHPPRTRGAVPFLPANKILQESQR